MAITFNNVPDTIRTPGVYVEIDNSRALQGLVQNPHKVLLLGQKIADGTADVDTLMAISRDNLADGFFGAGSILARMCNKFKENNENTELYAMALGSGIAGTAASTEIDISGAVYSNAVSANGTWYLMINGEAVDVAITSGMSAESIATAVITAINSNSNLPVIAAVDGTSAGVVAISAVNSGTMGNYINIRENYYDYQSIPLHFVSGSVGPLTIGSGGIASRIFFSVMAGGAIDPDLGDAWAVIDGEQFHYIAQPYIDATNLTEIEDELADRFLPLEDLQGHGFTAVRATQASATTLGNTRNSPHNTIVAANDSPTGPEEWAAAWAAVAAWNLNIDPARPLHTLQLTGILSPPVENRFTRAERDTLLYDGIATWIWDTSGRPLIERSITTYQTNALGLLDPSYLDVQTLATLGEIRYQYKTRMTTRFIVPRFKLADDSFPAQPGSKVARPKDVFSETVALFTLLRDKGWVENLDDFIDNLVVERNLTDRNRIDVLLPPDLVNQFRVLAGQIQFVL
jgi:phage tail sheath gpL-like